MTKTTKKASTKRTRPPVFTAPRRGGTYVGGTDEEHRTGGTEPADRHEKLEEADSADAN